MKQFFLFFLTVGCLSMIAFSQEDKKWKGKFEQLDYLLPTPNEFRTGGGAPGAKYWQQRADYSIDAEIDEPTNQLIAKETITYYNNSPEPMSFLWLQLDQNVNKKGNEDFGNAFGNMRDTLTTLNMQYLTRPLEFDAGYTISSVTDKLGKNLPVTINNTMMRIDLSVPIKSGEGFSFSISWSYPITDRSMFLLSREGYEHFPEDNNNVFLIAHWFPRMCQYDDIEGWQNKQFQRLGEFALEFGNYKVNITVPADHIIGSTGWLQNPKEVLSAQQLERFEKAKNSFEKPTLIVSEEEARAKEKTKSAAKKTWRFQADNVRDFAFASSRKFIWDAQAVKLPTNTVLCMSFYPKEGLPVWSEESTKAVKNAIEVYSKYTFDYPYPVAISVNTSNIGMEFPMISFNGGRPRNGKMSDNALQGMVGTIVHEVGHNYFPMIVSNDERQWMWMDEGLNTFLQTRTEAERYPKFHHTVPKDIVPYMKGDKNIMRPIMTTSDNEQLMAMGNNFYQKPTVALSILRETVMGPELFDRAFKEYANRWKYKHPRPADFFRTMEDLSAVDLDWFWRGWFYGTDNVDVELSEVKWYKMNTQTVDPEKKTPKTQQGDLATTSDASNDFSQGPKPLTVKNTPDAFYGQYLSRLDNDAVRQKLDGKNIYQLKFKNIGGLVTPIVIEWTYQDGSKEIEKLPAEIWRLNENEVTKVFVKDKQVTNIVVDPNAELADVNTSNNSFPKKTTDSKFDQLKKQK
ncbi:MAG: M1 family metallopeptidase [Bacteroidetes bacterium]|nr:M1 family metallopeptidase [Bacteroidota bacterium]MBS1981236.1 M1 family metallopeptidase [Bacteroidota bacterium]